jgi:hypothetical protein
MCVPILRHAAAMFSYRAKLVSLDQNDFVKVIRQNTSCRQACDAPTHHNCAISACFAISVDQYVPHAWSPFFS